MSKVMEKARILLVDEDKIFRMKVRHTLEREEGMEIIGDCTSAEEALSQVDILSPNIILMDTLLPKMDGIEACRHLTGNGHTCDVIMLSADQELVSYALSAGATFYFPKDLRRKELATAVRLICKWQSLKAENDTSVYSIRQIEAMIMENLTQFAAEEQTHDEEELEWLPMEGNGSNTVREVRLVIPLPHNASQLQRFIYQAEEMLQASTRETAGSWSDTLITFKLRRSAPLVSMLDKLVKMPEVEKVEEKEPVRARRFNFFKKIKPVLRKEISVTLSAQAQLPAVAEQALQYQELPKPQPQLVGAMVS